MGETDFDFFLSPEKLVIDGETVATREDVLDAFDDDHRPMSSFVKTLVEEHGVPPEESKAFVNAALDYDPNEENGVYRCDTEAPEDGDGGVEFIPVPEMTPDSYDMSDIEKMDDPTKHKLAAIWEDAIDNQADIGKVGSKPLDPDHEERHHYEHHKELGFYCWPDYKSNRKAAMRLQEKLPHFDIDGTHKHYKVQAGPNAPDIVQAFGPDLKSTIAEAGAMCYIRQLEPEK